VSKTLRIILYNKFFSEGETASCAAHGAGQTNQEVYVWLSPTFGCVKRKKHCKKMKELWKVGPGFNACSQPW